MVRRGAESVLLGASRWSVCSTVLLARPLFCQSVLDGVLVRGASLRTAGVWARPFFCQSVFVGAGPGARRESCVWPVPFFVSPFSWDSECVMRGQHWVRLGR